MRARSNCPPTFTTGWSSPSRRISPRGPARPSTSWPSRPSPGSSNWNWHRQASTRCWSANSRRPPSTTCSSPSSGFWLKLFATLLGRMPPDYQAWIVTDDVPAFVRFEGPLYTTGPVWRIELTSPRWPD